MFGDSEGRNLSRNVSGCTVGTSLIKEGKKKAASAVTFHVGII